MTASASADSVNLAVNISEVANDGQLFQSVCTTRIGPGRM